MIKDFFIRKTIEKQLAGVPKEQQEMLIAAIQKNPKLFEEIAKEIKVEMDAGKDQMAAAMTAFKNHEQELREALGK